MRGVLLSLLVCTVSGWKLTDVPKGYPSCRQTKSGELECFQEKKDREDQISIACVGDSITEGGGSSDWWHTYPSQLQRLLGDSYKVSNLGASGATLLKSGDSPYWDRPQFKTLTESKWDVIIVMLGTNDAKDAGSGGPSNWPHNCTGTTALQCPFSEDYFSLLEIVSKLGNWWHKPQIYTMLPPPLMEAGVFGMNQTVINKVLPELIPNISAAAHLRHLPIDVFDALGGNKQNQFPPDGCTVNTSHVAACWAFCDDQHCDQCHPNNAGYLRIAEVVKEALNL